MSFTLPPLPYDLEALNPYISGETLGFHYGKHHQAYVTNLNKLVEGTAYASQSLEEVIQASSQQKTQEGIFNNAAQVWNHSFYWMCMKPQGGGLPHGDLMQQILKDFKTFDEFKEAFKQAALSQFGSGWAWLVADQGHLKILKTSNADLPMVHGVAALLTCDVWEHAYYLDYQNRRPEYIDIFLNHLVNWDFVAENLAQL